MLILMSQVTRVELVSNQWGKQMYKKWNCEACREKLIVDSYIMECQVDI